MAASPPNLSERQKCHKARDEYFNCLDTVKDKSNCEELKKAMESVCRPTWVIITIHSTHKAIRILIVLAILTLIIDLYVLAEVYLFT